MIKDMAIIGVLLVLIAFSVVQAIEIAELKSSLSASVTGNIIEKNTEGKEVKKSSGAGGYRLPANLENLQTMVGGC